MHMLHTTLLRLIYTKYNNLRPNLEVIYLHRFSFISKQYYTKLYSLMHCELLANLILTTVSSKDPCLHNKGDKIRPMHNFTVAVVKCKLQLQLQLTVATVKLCINGNICLS